MTAGLGFGQYRGSRTVLVVIGVLLVSAALAFVALIVGAEVGPVIKVLGSVATVAVAGTLFSWAARAATTLSPDGVEVRTLWQTRRVPWRDIQDIRVEDHPARHMSDATPDEYVVLYDRSGRRVELSYFDDMNLWRRHGLRLHDEVAELRDTWRRRRGDDWAPVSGIDDLIADWQRHGSPLTAGIWWGLLAAVGTFAIVLAGLFAGLDERLPSALFGGGSLVVLPMLAYVGVNAAIAVTVVRRRRRLRARLGV